jgi:hypothetical protein
VHGQSIDDLEYATVSGVVTFEHECVYLSTQVLVRQAASIFHLEEFMGERAGFFFCSGFLEKASSLSHTHSLWQTGGYPGNPDLFLIFSSSLVLQLRLPQLDHPVCHSRAVTRHG